MILDELALFSKRRAQEARARIPFEDLRTAALSLPKGEFRFEKRLKTPDLSFICEVKKASPSKGVIAERFPYLEIAKNYEAAGADCVSCLTEPRWFLGSDDIFRGVRAEISLPMLRKDFTVDAYQIFEAKCMGADAVLLICALLDTETIAQYLAVCEDLGLSALVEAHDETEIASAVSAGARLIGVNNRNLKTFSVNIENAARLREKIPADAIFVAESGIRSPEDVALLRASGADAVLIGEALMKAEDKAAMLAAFRGAAR
ncbi:MAG: indole-3-glycerol phosphate synthase TrpC [Oscillospiraceae bacterium]|jgi:indole-3-glycerol phosphate synthase|nr:indole-3-glycerol phosphate synthase TrpC [Oscillospiraceae bacterium]